MNEAINAANDADLKERFENALRKHMPQMLNEDFGVVFDRSNKFHTSLYNDFLEVYFSKCGLLKLAKKKELVASVLRELAKDILGSANGSPSYLNEAEKIQPELSVDDLAKAEKGHKEIPVEVAGNERDIESVNRAIRAIESRIADTIQKKLNMEQFPIKDTDDIFKKLRDLQNERERLQKQLARITKAGEKAKIVEK